MVRVPRSMLGDDDGYVNAAAIVGIVGAPSDIVPAEGHLTLLASSHDPIPEIAPMSHDHHHHHDRDDERFDEQGNTRPTGSNYHLADRQRRRRRPARLPALHGVGGHRRPSGGWRAAFRSRSP